MAYEKNKYIDKAGVYDVKLTGLIMNLPKSVKFWAETEDNYKAVITIWMPKESDTPEQRELSEKRITEFIKYCGGNMGAIPIKERFESCLNKRLRILMRMEDAYRIDKETGERSLVTYCNYWYCGPVTKELKYKPESLHKKLAGTPAQPKADAPTEPPVKTDIGGGDDLPF